MDSWTKRFSIRQNICSRPSLYQLCIYSNLQLVTHFCGNHLGPTLQETEKMIDIVHLEFLYLSIFHPKPCSFITVIIITKQNAAVYGFLFGKSQYKTRILVTLTDFSCFSSLPQANAGRVLHISLQSIPSMYYQTHHPTIGAANSECLKLLNSTAELKAISLQAWTDPQGFRLPQLLTNRSVNMVRSFIASAAFTLLGISLVLISFSG